MNKTIKNIWNTITTIIVVLVVIGAVLLVGVRLVGIHPYTVLSGSMEPTYQTGSVVYVKKVDPNELKVNDVITYRLDNVTVTHRIIGIVRDETDPTKVSFETKGDANQYADNGLIPKENVIGSPVSTIPKLGYLADYIQHPPGIFFAAAAGVGVIILVLLSDILDEKVQASEEPKKKKKRRRRRVKKVVKVKKENKLVDNKEQGDINDEKKKTRQKKTKPEI